MVAMVEEILLQAEVTVLLDTSRRLSETARVKVILVTVTAPSPFNATVVVVPAEHN
jgi:hypothetical protein